MKVVGVLRRLRFLTNNEGGRCHGSKKAEISLTNHKYQFGYSDTPGDSSHF